MHKPTAGAGKRANVNDQFLDAPTLEDLEAVRAWRNASMIGLRSTHFLTSLQQANFYRDVISNAVARDRYWAVRAKGDLGILGLVGLTGIQWEDGLAEISVIIDPSVTRGGMGSRAVTLLLEQAFDCMRLSTVIGECYECNPALAFWRKILPQYDAATQTLPRRKFWAGQLWDSLYFTITREAYERNKDRNG